MEYKMIKNNTVFVDFCVILILNFSKLLLTVRRIY